MLKKADRQQIERELDHHISPLPSQIRALLATCDELEEKARQLRERRGSQFRSESRFDGDYELL